MALSGGTTPRGLYNLLADPGAPYRAAVPWDRTQVFFGDERQVPPDHPESNYRMANEALLQRVPIPEEHVHRIRGENPDPDRAAEEYEEIQRDAFDCGPDGVPRFDLALLGLGPDGHVASLFPGSAALKETHRLAVAVTPAAPARARVTLTFPVFNAAACVLFLVSGPQKADALKRVLRGAAALGSGGGFVAPGAAPGAPPLPAALVRPGQGDLLWLVDRDAAKGLG